MIGGTFGRLTVTRRVANRCGNIMFECLCSCGKTSTASGSQLRQGKTRSCGCLQRESAANSGKLHGTKHGMKGSPEYAAWCSMRIRCKPGDPRHKNYGARGITVCERWSTFANFMSDMGPRPSRRHSLDRKDVDGNYEPENCRWATPTEQQRNKRNSVKLTHNGITLGVLDWEDRLGFPRNVVYERITKRKRDVARAIDTPYMGSKARRKQVDSKV